MLYALKLPIAIELLQGQSGASGKFVSLYVLWANTEAQSSPLGSKWLGEFATWAKILPTKLELIKIINKVSKTDFFTFAVKTVFVDLWITFIKALILYYFDLKSHILNETNAFSYAIGGILSQLTLNKSFSRHIIDENPNLAKSGQ